MDQTFKRTKSGEFVELTEETMASLHMIHIAWYRRLWAVVKLPYDVVRFIITGKAYMGHFRGPF